MVADTRNQCLRRVIVHRASPPTLAPAVVAPPAEPCVETLMTNTFLLPRGPVALDGGSALAVCDSGHHKVRAVSTRFLGVLPLRFVSQGPFIIRSHKQIH